MFFKLFALFVVIPLVELYLLIKVGSALGAFHTVALVVLTATVGAFLAKLEGLRTWRRIERQLVQGQMPAEEFVDSILIFMAGMMLLTPGFLTDGIGLWILIPFTRVYVKRWLRHQFDRYLSKRAVRIQVNG